MLKFSEQRYQVVEAEILSWTGVFLFLSLSVSSSLFCLQVTPGMNMTLCA